MKGEVKEVDGPGQRAICEPAELLDQMGFGADRPGGEPGEDRQSEEPCCGEFRKERSHRRPEAVDSRV